MTRLARACRLERCDPRPVAGFVLLLREPAADGHQRRGDFVMSPADRMLLDQRGRSLSEGAGVDALGNEADPPFIVELDRDRDAAAAGWRAQLGTPVLTSQRAL